MSEAIEITDGLVPISSDEIAAVSGGVIPLAVAALYAGGFTTGVAAGWTFMSYVFGSRHCSV